MNQIITLLVDGSYIKYTGGSDGATTGSYKATTLRMTFSSEWDGTSKTVYFTDALGEHSVSVVLGLDRLVGGTTDTYDVEMPVEALTNAGYVTMTVKGTAVSGGAASRIITTAAKQFRVRDSEIPENVGNSGIITPSEKDQLQAEIDALAPMFTTYKEAAETAAGNAKESETAAASSAANAADSAKAAAKSAEAARYNYEEAEKNEAARVAAENVRKSNETARKEAEDSRALAEQGRKSAETARQENEIAREEAESARSLWEEYNAEKAYVPGNKVAFGGSSYLCIADCTGIEPTNTVHWLKIAEKGADGGGMVETTGAYGFSVENGNLFLHYTGDEAPPFSLDENGHLWLNLGNKIDLGKVKGDPGDFPVWQVYDGVDLTEKFADEIAAAPYSGDAWAWIRARIRAGNYSGISVKDWIPFTTKNNLTFRAEIAGIDTYRGFSENNVQHHIDFVSDGLWPVTKPINPSGYNNGLIPTEDIASDGVKTVFALTKPMYGVDKVTLDGTDLTGWTYDNSAHTLTFDTAPSTGTLVVTGTGSRHPWIASDLYLWLNSLAGHVATGHEKNPPIVQVDYTADGVYSFLPDALKAVITEKRIVLETRFSATGVLTKSNGSAATNIGKLWLPSESELNGMPIFGGARYAIGAAVQYPIFWDVLHRGKKSGNKYASWWLLTPQEGYSSSWCVVRNSSRTDIFNADNASCCVPICFRVA